MRLILVRHGQTKFNQQGKVQGWCDSPLTELGIKQAKATKKVLDRYTIDAVYTSTSERAIDTASIIIENRNLKLNYDKRLKELNFGIFEASPNDIKDHFNYRLLQNQRDYSRVCGESVEMVQKRSLSFMNEILQKHKEDETILIVSHGYYIWRFIIDFVYNGEIVNLPMKNACYNIIELQNGKWVPIILNEVGKLE